MRKLIAVLAAATLAGGAWLASRKYEIHNLDDLRTAIQAPLAPPTEPASLALNVERATVAVRIASFNIDDLDEAKAEKPQVMQRLAEMVRRFDIVALQSVREKNEHLLSRLIERVNADGRRYAYLASPPVGRGPSRECYAFLFDAATVEVDHSELYVVNDPDDLLRREPYVAWFRVRGPAAETAFTFSLVNVHVDPNLAEQELDVLADVFTAVRDDGRGEDDVILVGGLYADNRYIGRLNDLPGIVWAIDGLPTTTRGDAQHDNLVFDRRATTEFTGRIGVFDSLREFNLTLDQALELSDHLPVWAEFSAYEGGRGNF